MKTLKIMLISLALLISLGNSGEGEECNHNRKELKMKKVEFESRGEKMAGNLYLPPNALPNKKYPAIVVSGSWTTVKEQMAGTYAKKLAEKGFVTLAFDFRNYGESGGKPRFQEDPQLKIEDINSAVAFLAKHKMVDAKNIGGFGVCAGAMYVLSAAAENSLIKAVATAASWLHDAEAVKLFYGGEKGVQEKISRARAAEKKYKTSGKVEYIPTISTTDESAAMFGPYDYYLNPERGAIKEWSGDKFAVMSWSKWLEFDPMPLAPKIKQPVLMIHSDGAVLPHYTKKFYGNLKSEDKKLHWMKTDLESPFHQFNYYDQEMEVNESVSESVKWFNAHL